MDKGASLSQRRERRWESSASSFVIGGRYGQYPGEIIELSNQQSETKKSVIFTLSKMTLRVWIAREQLLKTNGHEERWNSYGTSDLTRIATENYLWHCLLPELGQHFTTFQSNLKRFQTFVKHVEELWSVLRHCQTSRSILMHLTHNILQHFEAP